MLVIGICCKEWGSSAGGIVEIDFPEGEWRSLNFGTASMVLRAKLVIGGIFAHRWEINITSLFGYRKCKRCGTTQCGVYDLPYQDIVWETTRERNYPRAEQAHIVRQPSSRFDQLAHTSGLRRTRMSDRKESRNGSAETCS